MQIRYLPLLAMLFSGIVLSSSAQNIINIGIGPTWPKGLRDTEKPTAWNGTVEYAKLFDNVIGVGADLDFSWNTIVNDTTYQDTNTVTGAIITKTRKYKDKKLFMFPLSVFLMVDPIPKYKLHPVIKAQIGVNMMVKSETQFDSTGSEITIPKQYDEGGFYIGVLGKVSADAVFDFGEHAALYGGFELQWGKLKKKVKDTENEYFEYNCLAPGIRMGLSFLF